MLKDGIELGEKWGFNYKTVVFVWDKERCVMGNYTMSQCEMCLVFKKGRIPQPRGRRDIRQFLQEKKGKHSVKPDEIRRRIEEMFPEQTKIELFARERKGGWDAWGDEV